MQNDPLNSTYHIVGFLWPKVPNPFLIASARSFQRPKNHVARFSRARTLPTFCISCLLTAGRTQPTKKPFKGKTLLGLTVWESSPSWPRRHDGWQGCEASSWVSFPIKKQRAMLASAQLASSFFLSPRSQPMVQCYPHLGCISQRYISMVILYPFKLIIYPSQRR